MSTKWVENGKKKKNVETGLRVECSLHERESGGTFIPVVYDNFLLLEGFVLLLLVLTVSTDYNYRGVSTDSVS